MTGYIIDLLNEMTPEMWESVQTFRMPIAALLAVFVLAMLTFAAETFDAGA